MIRVFFMDVDGTLSRITYYSAHGEVMKGFNLRDGRGIKLLRDNNIIPVIITGEKSKIVLARAKKLKITEVHMGVQDKLAKVKMLQKKYHLKKEEIAYVGDDVNDIEAMKYVGLSFAPQDAEEQVKQIADVVTKRRGGEGAVREAINSILEVK